MKDTYVIKRKKNGRLSKRGYMFDSNEALDRLHSAYIKWGHKLAILSFVIGFILGALCF